MGEIIVEFSPCSTIVKEEVEDDFSRRYLTGKSARLLHVRNKQIIKEDFREYIFIKVRDVSGWIKGNFGNISNANNLRISEERIARVNEIEYFYI